MDWFIEEKERRRARRRRTKQVAHRRYEVYVERFCAGDPPDKVRGKPLFFAKRGSVACCCVKRHHGRPKTSNGLCCIHDRVRIYKWRRQNRKLRDLIVRQGVEANDDSVAVLSNPAVPDGRW